MEEKDLKQIREVVTEAVESGNEYLAQLINTAFQAQKENFDEQLTEIKDTLHVIEAKVNKALNIEYVRLEKRLKVVEQKLGITVPAVSSD